MEELVKYVISNLVDDKDSFEVKTVTEGENTVINIVVDKKEIGKVIGKQGRIAKAIRMLVKAASKDGGKYYVDIIEK
ncbi:MAG TPA: KH domain-containing protein [Candidatus Caccalectryoclostridium excrementigallinarum]|uniref:RNA-binding protein KhpA n=1 Tax=Candidatus Caccalectryoclostridium excrementigallinarum TaxID=2840710 RepID=A0A9D1SKR8_9FIRM|nr:KH domain-containing protein [Candidatus Caccalectryoclostridium excrementigallinarum]